MCLAGHDLFDGYLMVEALAVGKTRKSYLKQCVAMPPVLDGYLMEATMELMR
jgi:hypothetical protein